MMQNTAAEKLAEETQKIAAEVQLQQYGEYFEKFRTSVLCIQYSLRAKSRGYVLPRINTIFQPEEKLCSPLDLINTENVMIDKIVIVFYTLCNEIEFLETEANSKFFNTIAYYGEGLDGNAPYEDCQLLLSKFLPVLQEVSNFVIHCERVCLDVLNQLASFYNLHFDITDAQLTHVFDSLSRLLCTVIELEEIINNNATLSQHWSLYKRTLQLASHKASRFPFEIAEIRQLTSMIVRIEQQLLSGRLFHSILCMENANKKHNHLPYIKGSKRLEEEFASYLKNLANELDKIVNREDKIDTRKLTKFTCSILIFLNLYGFCDKKILKLLSDIVMKKSPVIALRCHVLLRLDELILREVGSLLKPVEKKWFEKRSLDQGGGLKTSLADVTVQMNRDLQRSTAQILSWTLKMESKLRQWEMTCLQSTPQSELFDDIVSTLLFGVSYCHKLKDLLITVSNLHIATGTAMSKTSVLSFCRTVELIKSVYSTYRLNQTPILAIMNQLVQFLQFKCITILFNCKKNISTTDKRFKELRIDTISSIVTAENCLLGSPTQLRLTITSLCSNMMVINSNQIKGVQECDRRELQETMTKLQTITSLYRVLQTVTECNFMYWNKNTLPLYMDDTTNKRPIGNLHCVQYILDALGDTFNHLDEKGRQIFTTEIIDSYTKQVIAPICTKIEENLRLRSMVHLQQSPKQISSQLNNLIPSSIYTSTSNPLKFNHKYLDLRFQVESYLDRTFYDLTTVALHDWQIYTEMRELAKRKFRISVIADGLPNQTLEQGPDLLHITRNINTFVAEYTYNLNQQLFMESTSTSKHLNVINIKHTANSIRTHGAGIMSTAVNHTYQFLCKKLTIFSQFLYDEQIKSRMIKEATFFHEQTSINNNFKYPFDRAERLYRVMLKLGIDGEGMTYLNRFRILLTQMGNALGYVRLIRSGGLRYFSNAIAFVPSWNQVLCEFINNFPSSNSASTAKNLNDVVQNMSSNLSEGSNYFRLLVDVFSHLSEENSNAHLINFHLIVPALTINFVEHMITAKEGLLQKKKTVDINCGKIGGRKSLCFTDDGFSMGVAYMLHTLGQFTNFESLQWFQSVFDRNEQQRIELKKQIDDLSKEDLKLNHTANLSMKRIEIYQKEFRHLYYNIYSAQILFQSCDFEENRDEENNEGDFR